MTDDNLTAEIEKAMREGCPEANGQLGDGDYVCIEDAVAVCVAKIKHTKRMGRAAVEQAVLEERERLGDIVKDCYSQLEPRNSESAAVAVVALQMAERKVRRGSYAEADAIRAESKPPTEPSPWTRGGGWTNPEPPRCGTCGGSGLSGELSYGGFAKPCLDCQKETS